VKQLFSFIFKLAIVILLAVWLADRPGTARIVWHGYVIETSAAFLGLCVLFGALVIYWLFRFWHLIRHGPEIWRLRRNIKKQRDGQQQLVQGLAAVAAGDAPEAGRCALSARKALGVTPLTRLLHAQAAQLAGDRHAASEIFLALASDVDSAVLGYRGLIMEAARGKDWEEVERLAEKLRRLRPETPWLNLIRFELSARRQNWDEAKAALDSIARARLLEPAELKRRQAALLAALAQSAAHHGELDKALQAAEQAVRLAPGWTPALIMLVRRQMESGHKRAALRTIERAWDQAPHPQLAAAYRGADADPLDVYKQFARLCRGSEENPMSRVALAAAALDADIWGEARRHLLALVGQGQATQGAYRLLARLERRESGNEQTALQWLTRAVDAAPDAAWLCRACGAAHAEWQGSCHACGAFNTLDWQVPGQSRASGEISGGLLAAISE